MAHRLNTNKQFMIGNGILAFAVIFVVVIFVYMSMRLQRDRQADRHFAETYSISLVKGFAGDSISLFINDSLITNRKITRTLHHRSRPLYRAERPADCRQPHGARVHLRPQRTGRQLSV